MQDVFQAVIELGSKYLKLFVFKKTPSETIIMHYEAHAYLLEDLQRDKSSTWQVMDKYVRISQTYSPHLAIIGTALLRKSLFQEQLKANIKTHLHNQLDIVTAEQEAGLNFVANYADYQDCDSFLIIDIGGLSTELIDYHYGKEDIYCLAYGLMDIYNNLSIMGSTKDKLFSRLSKLKINKPKRIICAGEVGLTAVAIKCNQKIYDSQTLHKQVIKIDFIQELLTEYATLADDGMLTGYYFEAINIAQLRCGLQLITWLLEFFELDYYISSTKSVAYGYAMQKMAVK